MSTFPPVPNPVPQFCDADGHPYAGGTIATYIPGTTSPKVTYSDHLGGALNTNPIILDAAGRCTMYGDGEYRLVLRDSAGNLVWDQYATTLVSAAMAPVIIAPTLEEARRLMGIEDAIDAAVAVETNRATAAEAALGSRIDAETARATNAENALQSAIDAETAARIAADNALSGRVTALEGGGGAGAYAEAYTTSVQHTAVTIANSAGRAVRIEIGGTPGTVATVNPDTNASTYYQAGGNVYRNGTLLGVVGPPPPPGPGHIVGPTVTMPPWLDQPGAGTHIYSVDYFIPADVTAETGWTDWAVQFGFYATCYLYVELK